MSTPQLFGGVPSKKYILYTHWILLRTHKNMGPYCSEPDNTSETQRAIILRSIQLSTIQGHENVLADF